MRTRRERLRYWGWTAFMFLCAAAVLALAVDGVQQGGQDRTFALLGWLPFAVVLAIAGLGFVRGWVDRPLVFVVILIGLSLSSLAMIIVPEIPAPG